MTPLAKRRTLEDMQRIAAQRGGLCLSTHFQSVNKKLRWQCADGHQWEAMPHHVIEKTWCPVCASRDKNKFHTKKNRNHTLEEMQAAAAARGGLCLSKSYQNNYTLLRWQCAQCHSWEASFSNAKKWWCKICAKQQRDAARLEEMRTLARALGGECLSSSCLKREQLLRWRCKRGHEWRARAANIREGLWCTQCAKQEHREAALQRVQKIAHERGGECLSETYLGRRRKLQWLCALGHTWSAKPESIVEGHWCPACAYMQRSKLPSTRLKYLPKKSPCLGVR